MPTTDLFTLLEQFHWLRPLWLLGLLPVALFIWLLWLRKRNANNWQKVINPALLSLLIDGELEHKQSHYFIALFVAGLLSCIALAGPTWEKIPQPIHKSEDALIILFDLSPSMMAEDLKPSRLIRAQHKLRDILDKRKEGLTGLIVYAGEAHVVSPLTDDTATINNLVTALHPNIVPLRGSNTEMAVSKALQLFSDSGIHQGNILLITDGVETTALDTIKEQLDSHAIALSILGMGTVDGAPIPSVQGGFIKDRQGAIIITRLNRNELQDTAQELRGRYTEVRTDNRDIEVLLQASQLTLNSQTRQLEREFDTWREYGHWLVILLLPFIAFSFRRGLILSLMVLPLALTPETSYAYSVDEAWDDLWLRADQQGQRSLEQGKPAEAAKKFSSPQWQGSAAYRADDHQTAAEAFAQGDSADDHFNRGNALAKSGQLEEALAAYQKALDKDPSMEDAQANKTLLEEIKKEQEQKQEQKQEQQQSQNGDDSSEQNQDGEQQQGDGEKQQQDQQQSQSGDNDQSQGGNQQDKAEQDQQQAGEQKKEQSEEPKGSEAQEQKDSQEKPDESSAPTQAQESESKEDTEGQPVEAKPLSPEEQEQQQALEQWLRKIPDDPGGLLRRKFEHQYNKRRREYQQGTWEPPENKANERW